MNRLKALYDEQWQSPWLDNLQRSYHTSGQLAEMRDDGVRGLTSNPSIFQKAIQGSADYDEQFKELLAQGKSVQDCYWEMVLHDIHAACEVFEPLHQSSQGVDGYVSVEVDPHLAHDGPGTESAARDLDERINRPNVMIKIPATLEALTPIQRLVAEGRSINVTLIFSLQRYESVINAYIDGMEQLAQDPDADLSKVAGVASFFISRVDVNVDAQLEQLATEEALALRGKAAITQGHLAYRMFAEKFSSDRWKKLADRGAMVQRPLWASTGTKNPDYPDTLYVDTLIGPESVNTLPETTLAAFADHGTIARTIDADPVADDVTWNDLAQVGVDMESVAMQLEREGVEAFQQSFDDLIAALNAKAQQLS